MDEPTSVLTPQEADQLFRTLERLTREGCAILYISHRLEEVKRICHHATIMRHGKVVSECDPARETAGSLARMMVGSAVQDLRRSKADVSESPRLSVRGLSAEPDTPFGVALDKINLGVFGGEVVAIAGIAGNGQGELFDLLSGERTSDRAEMVVIDGTPVGHLDITRRRRAGGGFVPEERLGHGTVPGMKLSENIVLTRHSTEDELTRSSLVDTRKAGEIERRIRINFDVRMSHDDPEARALSGGNLQKFVIGRELDRKPGLLVVNQPTWGVDAGAAALIRQELIDLSRQGSAVLVISQDLDEIFEIADRVAVISRGKLSVAEPIGHLTRERVGLLMGGLAEKSGEGQDAA
jgi:simple sugar transport system ATP-binding protein